MLPEICLKIVFFVLIIKAVKRPRNFLPGPRGLPLLGYLPFLSSWDPKYPHRAMQKMSEVYGPVTGFYLGPSTLISVCSREAVKEALLNEDLNGRPIPHHLGSKFWRKFRDYVYYGPVLAGATPIYYETLQKFVIRKNFN